MKGSTCTSNAHPVGPSHRNSLQGIVAAWKAALCFAGLNLKPALYVTQALRHTETYSLAMAYFRILPA